MTHALVVSPRNQVISLSTVPVFGTLDWARSVLGSDRLERVVWMPNGDAVYRGLDTSSTSYFNLEVYEGKFIVLGPAIIVHEDFEGVWSTPRSPLDVILSWIRFDGGHS